MKRSALGNRAAAAAPAAVAAPLIDLLRLNARFEAAAARARARQPGVRKPVADLPPPSPVRML